MPTTTREQPAGDAGLVETDRASHRRDGTRDRRRAPFWLRSVQRRPAAFVWLAVLSAAAVAVSILAPLLLGAVREQTLADATGASADRSTRVTLITQPGVTSADAFTHLPELERALDSGGDLFAGRGRVIVSSSRATWTIADAPATTRETVGVLVAPQGTACGRIRIAAGRCATSGTEVVVPADRGAQVGSTIELPSAATALGSVGYEVVGTYIDQGRGPLPLRLADASGRSANPKEADLVMSTDGLDRARVGTLGYSSLSLRHPLRVTQEADVRHGIRRVLALAAEQFGDTLETRILPVLARVDAQHDAAGILLSVTGVQALGVAWFAEGIVIGRIARSRAREWGVARLRGLSRRRRLGTVFTEPAVALVVGIPIGIGIGAMIAAVLSAAVVGRAAALDLLDPLVPAAAALAVVGSIVALVVASVRSATVPLDALLRETAEPRRLTRAGLVVQSGAVLVTVVVLVAALTQGEVTGPQLPLLAPALVAIVAGILALRITVAVVRRFTRRAPRTLAGVVVGRQLARTPSTLSTAVAIIVAMSIAAFTLEAAVVGTRLQTDRAAAAVAAARVATVSVPTSVSLLDAVRKADPSGRRAMAARELVSATSTNRVVAVDAARLATVSSWRTAWSGMSTSELERRLVPPVGPSLELRGTQLRVTLRKVGAGVESTPAETTRLEVVVQNASGWHTVDLGVPVPGELAPAAMPCADGCRIAWLGLANTSTAPGRFGARLTIASLATDRQSAASLAPLLDPNRWRLRIGGQLSPNALPAADIYSGDPGLTLNLTNPDGDEVASVAPRDAPEPLPVLLAARTGIQGFPGLPGAITGYGLDGNGLLFRSIGRASILPRSLGDGALVDLGLMSRVSDPATATTRDEVWLAAGNQSEVLAALRADGIRVTSTRSLASVRSQFAREAQTRAAQLSLPIGIVQIVLVLLAMAAVRTIGVGMRRRDWAALATAGVPRYRIRRLVLYELLMPSLVAVLIGLVAGAAVFAAVAPRLPLLASDGAVPPADLSPAFAELGWLAAAVALAIALIAAIAPLLEVRELEDRS